MFYFVLTATNNVHNGSMMMMMMTVMTTVVMVMMNSRNVFFPKCWKLGYAKRFCKVFYLGETWSCNLKEDYMSKLNENFMGECSVHLEWLILLSKWLLHVPPALAFKNSNNVFIIWAVQFGEWTMIITLVVVICHCNGHCFLILDMHFQICFTLTLYFKEFFR